jgi:hypothetical protein
MRPARLRSPHGERPPPPLLPERDGRGGRTANHEHQPGAGTHDRYISTRNTLPDGARRASERVKRLKPAGVAGRRKDHKVGLAAKYRKLVAKPRDSASASSAGLHGRGSRSSQAPEKYGFAIRGRLGSAVGGSYRSGPPYGA